MNFSYPTDLKIAITFFLALLVAAMLAALLLLQQSLFPFSTLAFPSVGLLRAKYCYPPLKKAVLTNMKQYFATEQERHAVLEWLDQGSERKRFYRIYPIIERRCLACHGAGMSRGDVSLVDWADTLEVVLEPGVPTRKLLQQTHVHLFGMGFLLLVVSFFWSRARFSRRLRLSLILSLYLALSIDISSWWLAKFSSFFASMIWLSGMVLYPSLFLVLLLTIYDLWRTPAIER